MTAIERLALLAAALLLAAAIAVLIARWDQPPSAVNWLAGGATVLGLGTFLSVTRRKQRRS